MKYHAHSTDLQTKLDAVTIDPSKTYTPDWGPSLKQLEKSFAKLSQAMQDNTLRYVFLGPRYGKSYAMARLQEHMFLQSS